MADSQAEAALLARIEAEIGEARCTQSAQCRTLPVGAKACGGPTAWLAWSVATTTRPDLLHALAAELTAMQRRRHDRDGLASDCRYIVDPGATCQALRCVTQPAGASQR